MICGDNKYGQLGMKDKKEGFQQISFEGNISEIHCMSESYLAKVEREDKFELYAWGWNEHGNLGCGDKEDRNQPTMIKKFENDF